MRADRYGTPNESLRHTCGWRSYRERALATDDSRRLDSDCCRHCAHFAAADIVRGPRCAPRCALHDFTTRDFASCQRFTPGITLETAQ